MALRRPNGGERVTSGSGLRRLAGRALAAYLIVLQAVLAGLALGAAPVAADPLSIICNAAASDSSPAQQPDRGHKSLPGCCVSGCPMLSGWTAPPPAGAVAPRPAARNEAVLIDRSGVPPPAAAGRTPLNPRAPPARS